MDRPEYGETWVYESIFGALPGVDLSSRAALAIQFLGFELAILVLAWVYDLWAAAVAGTVAVAVATAGSVGMLRIAREVRSEAIPPAYRRLLFGSSVEVVLALFAYVALVTYLFVWSPSHAQTPLLDSLFGPDPPVLAVYVTLLVLWDVCYRIGTGWWASVAALWRSVHYRFDDEARTGLRRADLQTMVFGLLQLAFVPFLLDQPLLLVAVVGHVVAVETVAGLSVVLLARRKTTPESP